MTLITAAQHQKLLENGRAQRDAIDREDQVLDFEPVVKLFTADGNATWLLTELNPDFDLAFGLCDLGVGEPEVGFVSLAELSAARGPLQQLLEDNALRVWSIGTQEKRARLPKILQARITSARDVSAP
jgi:hypothetical protein